MKRIVFLLLTALSISAKAQITADTVLNFVFNALPMEVVNTTGLGTKVCLFSNNGDTITIFNSDWSLYKTVVLPTGYLYTDMEYPMNVAGLSETYIPSFSDKLFNNDDLLEFLAIKNISQSLYSVSVINELGQIDYTFPDSVSDDGQTFLMLFGSSFKLGFAVGVTNSGLPEALKTYNLPGSLPCNQCNYSSGIAQPGAGTGGAGLMAYPNPFSNTLSVKYNLPVGQTGRLVFTSVEGKELKSIALKNTSGNLVLETADLPKGVLLISLYGSNQHLISKKLVKIE